MLFMLFYTVMLLQDLDIYAAQLSHLGGAGRGDGGIPLVEEDDSDEESSAAMDGAFLVSEQIPRPLWVEE